MKQENKRYLRKGKRQLFLDDIDVAEIVNLKRTLHPVEKKGAVIRPSLLRGHLSTRTAPIWDPDGGVFKMWVCCIMPEGTRDERGCSGYYVSEDGLNWQAPQVGQVEVDGSKENNLVFFPRGEGRTSDIYCVARDPRESDPTRRYKGWTYDRGNNALLLAASPDGITWTPLDVPPIPSRDQFNLSYDQEDGLFIATVKVKGPYGRSHALTTSRDFYTWAEPELVFHADDLDQTMASETMRRHIANPMLQQPVCHDPADYGADIYNFPVSRYEDLYIGFPMVFHHTGEIPSGRNHDGFHHIQIAVSRDMRHWQRVADRAPFIQPSPLHAGAYDLLQIIAPSFPIPRDDELWFYYAGAKRRHPAEGQDRDNGAICLATLRRDGFVSLDADDSGGTITTLPFQWEGDQLHLNAIADNGEIHCEFIGRNGMPIVGYTGDDCQPISGDGVQQTLRWQGQSGLPTNEPLQLRVYLRNAQLFSYWIE